MTITPKVTIRLFNKLKSQNILYNLDFPHNDRSRCTAYCVAYSCESPTQINKYNKLYFRKTDNNGWNLRDRNSHGIMIFDPKENQNLDRNCYWAVNITPEVAKEFLRQRREYLKTKK